MLGGGIVGERGGRLSNSWYYGGYIQITSGTLNRTGAGPVFSIRIMDRPISEQDSARNDTLSPALIGTTLLREFSGVCRRSLGALLASTGVAPIEDGATSLVVHWMGPFWSATEKRGTKHNVFPGVGHRGSYIVPLGEENKQTTTGRTKFCCSTEKACTRLLTTIRTNTKILTTMQPTNTPLESRWQAVPETNSQRHQEQQV